MSNDSNDYFLKVVYQIRTSCSSDRLKWLHGMVLKPDGEMRDQYINQQLTCAISLRSMFCKHLQCSCWLLELQTRAGNPVMTVARLQSETYPTADQRFAILMSEDNIIPGAVITAFPMRNDGSIIARWGPNLVNSYDALKDQIYEAELERKKDKEEHASAISILKEEHMAAVGNLRQEFAEANKMQQDVNESLLHRLETLEKGDKELTEKDCKVGKAGRTRSRDRGQRECTRCRYRPITWCKNVLPGMEVFLESGKDMRKMYVTREGTTSYQLCDNKGMRGARAHFDAELIKMLECCSACQRDKR